LRQDRPRDESESENVEVRESADYELLLRQYGEAMLRIGTLEAQVERLTLQLQDSTEGQHSGDRPQPDAPETGVTKGPPAPAQPDNDELRQVRVQLTAMAGRLARTEDELEKAMGSRPRRRRGSGGHRPWWKKAAGRLGIRTYGHS
jgi:hypothetical protein